MKFTKSIIIAIVLILGILSLSTGEANSWSRYRIYTAPVVMVSKPSPNHIWVEGHWKVNRYGKKVWVLAHWKRV